jgi:prepilin-type N-terminal cleavage/methylation domain-containing protein
MKKGFTLIELMVAIGLFAIMIAFSTVIFKASIEAQRVAGANAEIMQNLRVITDQMNRDFRGFRKESGLAMSWEWGGSTDPNDLRADAVAFLADGDFQSTGQYGSGINKNTIVGNVASICYGQARGSDIDVFSVKPEDKKKKILTRRQTILTSDTSLKSDPNSYNPYGEYYLMPLAEWDVNSPLYVWNPDKTLNQEASVENWTRRSHMKVNEPNTSDLVIYMARGVDDFTVQLEYVATDDTIQWWPTNKEIIDNHASFDYYHVQLNGQLRALKFTFTLYDSRGIIKNGMRFSHIVYIGN